MYLPYIIGQNVIHDQSYHQCHESVRDLFFNAMEACYLGIWVNKIVLTSFFFYSVLLETKTTAEEDVQIRHSDPKSKEGRRAEL